VAQGRLPQVVSLQRPDNALLERQGSFGLDIGCLAKLFSPFEFSSSFLLRISNFAPACPGWSLAQPGGKPHVRDRTRLE
jgi:hypothetical protein